MTAITHARNILVALALGTTFALTAGPAHAATHGGQGSYIAHTAQPDHTQGGSRRI